MKPDRTYQDVLTGKAHDRVIYEDAETIAFLDRNPVTKGHALVIPRKVVDHLDDCDPKTYEAIFKTVQIISKLLKERFAPERVALIVHGFEIPHAHVHVIPVYKHGDLRFAKRPKRVYTDTELQHIKKFIVGGDNA